MVVGKKGECEKKKEKKREKGKKKQCNWFVYKKKKIENEKENSKKETSKFMKDAKKLLPHITLFLLDLYIIFIALPSSLWVKEKEENLSFGHQNEKVAQSLKIIGLLKDFETSKNPINNWFTVNDIHSDRQHKPKTK